MIPSTRSDQVIQTTGPVYLIFQFCHHGDLLNYLKSNRENFYKSLTDAFNKDRFNSLYENCQGKRNSRFKAFFVLTLKTNPARCFDIVYLGKC